MATVLRVKRRCDEEPMEALVFACKKRKESEDSSKEVESSFAAVVKFTATVKAQESDLSLLLPINDREDIWKSRFNHKVDIVKKLREQRKRFSEDSRFKIVNCYRHVDGEEGGEIDTDKKDIIVYDIESSKQSVTEDPENMTSNEDLQYVYDIYYGHTNSEYDFTSLDHIVDIMPVSSFDFGTQNGTSDDDSVVTDDDDSNDENNWRNDYPDSDHSINEDDMRLAMQMGDMNIGNDLSSSDEELVYGVESDPQDVEYYGEVYAKYKARVQRELKEEEEGLSTEEENDSADDNGALGSSDDENEDPVLRFM